MTNIKTRNFTDSLPIHSAGFLLLTTIDQRLTAAEKMQNKPNLQSAQISLSVYDIVGCGVLHHPTPRKNKPNFKFVTDTQGNDQILSAKGRIHIFDFLLFTFDFFQNKPNFEDITWQLEIVMFVPWILLIKK